MLTVTIHRLLVVLPVVVLGALGVPSTGSAQEPEAAAVSPPEAAAALPVDDETPFTFATLRNIAKRQMPCVVNVVSEMQAEEAPEDFPLFRFYRDAPDHPDLGPSKGTGSGLIISTDGLVLTNHHVVETSKSVEITLHDGTSLPATIIGRDPQLDIALLKVEPGSHSLQSSLLGDSDRLEIGDWVLAIGSPYGLSHSVSAGIVSALGRDIHSGAYDSFIQTDAAINRGNSGGPLFNIRGEVVGINTAIISTSGGSNGIGFAIPINQVKEILGDLRTRGEVVRGWIGVGLRDLTKQDQTALGLDSGAGSLVTDVWDDSPALAAGLTQNDVIVRFGELEIPNTRALLLAVSRTRIGTNVPMHVLRKAAPVTLEVMVAARPDELGMSAQSLDPESVVRPRGLGASFQSVDDALRERFELTDETGFVVVELEAGAPADAAGLQIGDLLLEINRKRITTAEELLKGLKSSKNALVLVRRGPKSLFFSIDTAALDGTPEVKQN